MTFILDMAPEIETQVREAAAREGLEPERYVLRAVEKLLGQRAQANSPSPFQDLEAGYRAMAAEKQREAEALAWAEGMRSCSD